MKFLLSIPLWIFYFSLFSQTKVYEFMLLDEETKTPIEYANIFYAYGEEGYVSNMEGRVRILVRDNDTISISHISYTPIEVKVKHLLTMDTVYLKQKTFQLKDVYVTDLDLKNKLLQTYKNFSKLYKNKSLLRECSYKETVKINNKLSRFILVDLKWWSKNNRFNFKKLEQENHFSLTNIHYSLKKDSIYKDVGGGGLETRYITSLLYLDWHIWVLTKFCPELSVIQIKKGSIKTEIVFNADVIEEGDTVYKYNESSIVFDNKTEAITNIKLNTDYKPKWKKDTTKNGVPGESKINNIDIGISYRKINKKKWELAYINIHVYADVTYGIKKNLFSIESNQTFFVTKTMNRGNIKKKNRINIKKPFYENIPEKISKINLIPLTKEEKEFLKGKVEQ